MYYFFTTFAEALLSRSRKTSHFCPQTPPPGGRGEGGAFPPPKVARVAQRPLRGRAEDAHRSSEDAPRPLRDRSEDGQKRSEDARSRLEDSVYSVHKSDFGKLCGSHWTLGGPLQERSWLAGRRRVAVSS